MRGDPLWRASSARGSSILTCQASAANVQYTREKQEDAETRSLRLLLVVPQLVELRVGDPDGFFPVRTSFNSFSSSRAAFSLVAHARTQPSRKDGADYRI